MKSLGITLMSAIILTFFAYSPAWSFSNEKNDVEELRREITILNLINGLNLTDQQAKEILKYAIEAKAVKDPAMQDYKSLESDFITALTHLRDNLYDKNSKPSADIERHAAILNHEIKEKKEWVLKELKRIEEKVKSVLTPGQTEIVQTFKPCLIPPKDLKNPVRAGQAFDSSPAEKLLERTRSIPDKKYAEVVPIIANEYINRMESHMGEMTEAEKNIKTSLLLKAIDKARNMTDEEFVLNKRELAMYITPDDGNKKPDHINSRLVMGNIGRFLLDEKVITILEKRLKLSKGQNHTGSSGLLSIKGEYDSKFCALKTK
ncbi:MAG: hypothetical protein A2073_00905 [Deltaproteobacteria bacterium GWC2_42_11]|nr:MAG: hypothetical protein A2073_00905 [Deltaproteobacteria bacterium GWC2_42_11]HBO83521.1 hypothetical protein [Deltaproteobacteria bacterium]